MSVTYACHHLDTPRAPLPPSYPSSSSSYHPLDRLYFCEECDAIRCDLCVAFEVASYFCPNCLFDVPSANVRADKNRCARSCFSCPQCDSSLSVQASDVAESSTNAQTPSYLLVCTACRWSSREVGWAFDRPNGIALQLQKMLAETETVQAEFDSLKDHLEAYIAHSAPAPSPARSTRVPSRNISQLTQMAAKALHRDVSGMTAHAARDRSRRSAVKVGGEHFGWDEMPEYAAKGSWTEVGLEKGLQDVEVMRGLRDSGYDGLASLEKRWGKSWDVDRMAKSMLPQRIPLRTKTTKRCPHPNCRHLLIQPDPKSVRMKIKMVALNYLPVVELGRRKRRVRDTGSDGSSYSPISPEEADRLRRDRRRTRGPQGKEEEEPMDAPLRSGETYTFQLALTNPLFDPIQIRLGHPHVPGSAPPAKCRVFIPTAHFTINALKDAWAYDEEEDEYDGHAGASEAGHSEEGTAVTSTDAGASSTLGRKSRLSVLAGGSKKSRESGVDKRGNTSRVVLEVEVLPGATGRIEFDLEIRYTYRADDLETPAGGAEKRKEEYKTFTFWVRVAVGDVAVE
ncbi:hypothetical protein IAU60_000968 [Kwoniella sp. DSM 27419]